MSRFDRDQRDAERAARRARRLAERAQQRAQRRSEQARRAAERADALAGRVHRRDRQRSFEDYVDDIVDDYSQRWSHKADQWFGAGTAACGTAEAGDDDDAELRARRRARREAARARRAAEARAERRRRRRSGFRPFRLRFNSGRSLYRDKSRGKVCGVCAGLADYLDVEVWQVRALAVLGLVFAAQVTVPVYFIMCFLMDDKPYYRRMTDTYDDDLDDEDDVMDGDRTDRPRRASASVNSGLSNVEKLRIAKERFADLESRLRSMESHVTSSRFELQRELRKIAGEDA